MKNLLIILLIIFPCLTKAQEGLFGYSPSLVKGQYEVSIWYNPTHPDAKLPIGETVCAGVTFLLAESFDYINRAYELELADSLYRTSFVIPHNCMKITTYFYNASSGGLEWNSLVMDVTGDNDKPIINNYPAYPYRNKWFEYPFLFGEDTARVKITKEMDDLNILRGQDPLGVMFSKAYGYLLTGEEAKSRSTLKKMFERYPNHQLTYQALESYHYMVYAGKVDSQDGAKEIDSLQLMMVRNNPHRAYSRLFLGSRGTEGIGVDLVEQICQHWIKEYPKDAHAYMRLVSKYREEGIHPKKIIELSRKGSSLFLDPESRVYLNLQGRMTNRFLSHFAHFQAEAWLQLGNYYEALHSSILANGYLEAGNKRRLEGQIWMALKNYSEAESSLIKAIKLGDKEAKDMLREVHTIHYRNELNFEEYLAQKLGKDSVEIEKSDLPKAPDFSISTIQGHKLSLKDLEGKVIVINFWNLGCGPCRAEMPELNKLVAKYSQRDVVFIAISNDKKVRIQEFLKNKEFDYLQVSDARHLFRTFGTNVMPTHIIINKKGEIHHRFTGGGKGVFDRLDGIVDALL